MEPSPFFPRTMIVVIIFMLYNTFASVINFQQQFQQITVSLSQEGSELILYGSEWSPLFISSRVKGRTEQNAFTKLVMKSNREWNVYTFAGVDYEGIPKLTWINTADKKPYHLTKKRFIEMCNNYQVGLYLWSEDSPQRRFVFPTYKVPLVFTSAEGPDIVWSADQFAAQCNNGKVAWQKKNIFGRRRFIMGEKKKNQAVELKVLKDGDLYIGKIANDMTGNVWSITLKPQSEYYFELRDDNRKWKRYQFLGAFKFDDGVSRIVVTNVGKKGDSEVAHVFMWTEKEFLDECHNGNLALMNSEWKQGVDLHGIVERGQKFKDEDRTQITVDREGKKMNIYGIGKRAWRKIDNHYPFEIQSEDGDKWILYRLNEEKMFAHREEYGSYDDDVYAEYDAYDGYNEKTLRLLERLSLQ